ncbi:helix-turn-helix domain-containing protein [[Clostridium] leptum]|nr:helix-turn-helix domain-containing protein [[Clostridium] leptum]
MMDNIFRDYRRACGYTQCQLADMVGVDQTTVSKWEHEIAYPHVSQLLILQRVLHIPDQQLLNGLQEIESRRRARQ